MLCLLLLLPLVWVFFFCVVVVVAEVFQQQYESQEMKAAAEGVMSEDALELEVAVTVVNAEVSRVDPVAAVHVHRSPLVSGLVPAGVASNPGAVVAEALS